ncbi:MAG: hypothetical protein K6U03_05345 [Firmicutes bacterium]|nr:hypothetical protein [Bacillota bacterium]
MERFLIPFLLYQIPEAFLLITTALGLLGFKLRPGRLVAAGLGLGMITWLARHFLFGLFGIGLHTWAILFALTLALVIGFKISLTTALTGCFLSFFLLLMGESLIAAPVLTVTRISYSETLTNPWLHVGFGWISSIFLVVASVASHIFGFILITAPENLKDIQERLAKYAEKNE